MFQSRAKYEKYIHTPIRTLSRLDYEDNIDRGSEGCRTDDVGEKEIKESRPKHNKVSCIYMLREQRFTSRSIVVCREGGVLYWPCGGGR